MTMWNRAAKAVLLGGCAAAALGFTAAQAQDAAPDSSSSVEEIVVTAQRRSERLEDVPMSVTAVTAQTIEKAGVTNIHELGRIAPGVQVNFAGGFTQPSIRGITSLTNGVGFENNVAIYIDGFYSPDMVTVNGDLANIGSMEVLKGPQGTLYGRNATGGAILINTLAPSRTFTGKLEGSYATFDDKAVAGYVSGPITDSVRYSVAAYFRDSDGYMRLTDPTQVGVKVGNAAPLKQQSVRAKLEADLTPNLTATLAYNYGLVSDARGLLFTPFDHVPASIPAPPGRATGWRNVSYNHETVNLGITDEGTLKLAYKTPIGTLTSYTGFAHRRTKLAFDFDGSYSDITYSSQRWKQDTFQQGLDFAIDAIDKLDLVVGASYYHDKTKTDPDVGISGYITGKRLNTMSNVELTAEAFAVYADATYHLTDALSVNLGGRYSYEKKTIDFQTVNGAGTYLFVPTERDETFKKFTPRASIRYEVAPRTNVYASFSKGFRSGSFNATGAANPDLLLPIEPENVTAYEVGFKTARGMFRFDAAAFYYDYKDINVAVVVPNPVCPGGTACPLITRIANAPGAEVYGLDSQLTISPMDGLNIRAGAAYLHGRYTDFPNATGTGFNAATGLNITGQTQDWSDKQMARSPTFTANLGVDYEFPFMEGELLLAANVNYTDSFVISNPSIYGPAAGAALATKQRLRQDGYTLVNAQATWTDPTGHYYVGVFGRNLTDKKYLSTYNASTYGDYGTPAQPRTFGMKVGYQF